MAGLGGKIWLNGTASPQTPRGGSCCKGRKSEGDVLLQIDRYGQAMSEGGWTEEIYKGSRGRRKKAACWAPPLLSPVPLWKPLNVSARPWLRAAAGHECGAGILYILKYAQRPQKPCFLLITGLLIIEQTVEKPLQLFLQSYPIIITSTSNTHRVGCVFFIWYILMQLYQWKH